MYFDPRRFTVTLNMIAMYSSGQQSYFRTSRQAGVETSSHPPLVTQLTVSRELPRNNRFICTENFNWIRLDFRINVTPFFWLIFPFLNAIPYFHLWSMIRISGGTCEYRRETTSYRTYRQLLVLSEVHGGNLLLNRRLRECRMKVLPKNW